MLYVGAMRFAFVVLASLTAMGCVESTGRPQPPHTVTVARVGREGEPRTDAPTMFVWGRDRQGAAWTYQVQPDGRSETRLEGIHLSTRAGTFAWVTQTLDVETEPCDLSLGSRHPAQGGTVTRGLLVGPGQKEQVVVDPPSSCNEHCPNELRHEVHPVASLGPYLFVEESQYAYACGAHGSTTMGFLVWDIEHGRPVDVVSTLPKARELRAQAAARFAADEKELGGPFGEGPPSITEIVPVVEDHRLGFEAQLTIDTCYACSDGKWSSYTRSVRVRTPPPPLFAQHAELPDTVAAFLARHPDLTLGGFTEGHTPSGPPAAR